MTEEFYDAVAEAKKKITDQFKSARNGGAIRCATLVLNRDD